MSDGLSLNPTEQLLADSAARLQEVAKPAAPTGATASTAPSALSPDLVRSFEAAADQYGVPVDALLAIAEKDSNFDHLSRSRGPGAKTRGIINVSDAEMAQHGINPYDAPQAIGVAAQKLKGFLDSGMSIDDAIRSHVSGPDRAAWGPQTQEYLTDVQARAKRLADTLYPEEAPVDPAAHNMDAPKPAAAAAPGVLGTLNDMRVAVDQGLNMMVQDIDGVARKVLPERVMNAIDAADRWMTGGKTGAEAAKANEERLQKEYSPKMRESLAKKWWNQDKGEFGDAFSDWRAYAGAVLQSLPESIATSGPALKLAKGAYALNIARGATPAVAAARAATVATVAGAVTEGALGGAQSEREVKEEIEKLPIATLRQSDAFKMMVAQGMSEDAARHALAKDMGTRAFVTGGIATGVFGGMGDRIIAKTFLGRAAGASFGTKLKRIGAAFAGEGLAEELPQSVLQQVAQNEAVRHVDPNKSLMDDVINQGLGGAVAGGLMGVGMGGAFHRATRDTEQPAASPSQPVSPEANSAQPPAPAPPTPGPTIPSPPPGPLGKALAAGAPHMSEAAKPAGGAVTVTEGGIKAPDGRELDPVSTTGHVIAQDADGVTIRTAEGQDVLYSPEDLSSGRVKITSAEAMDTAGPAKPEAAPVDDAATKLEGPQKFAPETGTLGVPRVEMPQVKSEHHGALVNHLNAKGIAHETTEVDPGKLKPTQAEYDPAKVEKAKDAEGDRAVIVSNDGHIIDGHHQAMAAMEKDEPVKAIVLDAPAKEALAAVKAFPSAETPAAKAEGGKTIADRAAEAVQPTQHAPERGIAEMDEPELRARLKYLASQSKANGWTKRLIQERQKVEHEIALRQRDAAPVTTTDDGETWWKNLSRDERMEAVKKSGYAVSGPGFPWRTMSEDQRARLVAVRDTVSSAEAKPVPKTEAPKAQVAEPEAAAPAKPEVEKPDAAKASPKPAGDGFSIKPLNDDAGRYAIASGAQLYSETGRALARSPKWTDTSGATRRASLNRQNAWLASEAIHEADARGDRYMAAIFGNLDPKNMPRAHYNMVNEYIFGSNWGPKDKHFIEPEAKEATKADIADPGWNKMSGKEDIIKRAKVYPGVRDVAWKNLSESAQERIAAVVAEDRAKADAALEARENQKQETPKSFADEQKPPAPPAEAAAQTADPAAQPAPKEKGSLDKAADAIDDKIAEAEDELAAIFKSMHGQLNSGFPPELVAAGVKLGTLYVAKGVVKFGQFAKAIYDALRRNGVEHDPVKAAPYIKGIYNQLKMHVDDETFARMDDERAVRAFDVASVLDDTAKPEEPKAEQKTETEPRDDRPSIHQSGPQALETVAAEDGPRDAKERNTERAGAEGEPGRGRSGGEPHARGDAEARGGGDGPARPDPAQARAGRRVKASAQPQAKTRGEEVAARAKDEPGQFEQSPEAEIRESAPINAPAVDFVIKPEHEIGKGGEAKKFGDNLAAIRALKQIEQDGRRATQDEQALLARYVGWGGLKNAFRVAGSTDGEGVAKGWEKRVSELEELLTPDELKAARNSTVAAHYTSPAVVNAMWRAVERLGFAGGAVLEPSVGTGNFLGLMPEFARGKSNVFAVEYDSLTARIAKQLYPNMDIVHSGFQSVPLPRDQFALAIGNPPFGKDKLHFRFNPAVNGKSIHNQFFMASLDAVRPGGLMSMVVSHNLMDALDSSARMEMAQRAEFVGAIRLPDTAFRENARTDVVTDIMFFRKRSLSERAVAQAAIDDMFGRKTKDEDRADPRFASIKKEIGRWTGSDTINDPAGSGETINVNSYFTANPDMVVGKIDASGSMNARASLNVRLENPAEFDDRLNKAIERLPRAAPADDVAENSLRHFDKMVSGMKLAVARAEPGQVRATADGALKTVVYIDAGEAAKSMMHEIVLSETTPFSPDYTYRLDGKWQRTSDVKGADGKPVKALDAEGKPTRFNAKQTTVYENEADIPEKDRWGAERIARVRGMLPIRNLMKRQIVLESQDASPKMLDDNRERLNAAYDRFVLEHGNLHDRANDKIALTMPDGGLIMSAEAVDKEGRVSKSAIMSRRVTEPPKKITSTKNVNDAIAVALSESGRIDPARIAALLGTDEAGAIKAMSEGEHPRAFFDPESNRWEPSDLYLSGLVRKKLTAAREAGLEQNIKALENVIPTDWDSSQIVPNIGSAWIPSSVYADFLKSLGYGRSAVAYSPVTNSFTVGFDGKPAAQWETSDRALSPGEIVSRLLNSQPIKVQFKDNEGRMVVDEEATAESQQKGNELFNEFLDWAYQDDGRREQLVRIFNDKNNTRVVRQRDGSHLTLPGKVPDSLIKMRRHQMNGIWRGITDRAVLYDHVVGAGKTFTAISRIMERRRMGLSRKAMVVVPNHLVEQWAKDVTDLYPAAQVLAAGKADFEKANRRSLFAKIATGDHDMVIIGHSSFGFIDLDRATEERYLTDELDAACAAVSDAKEEAAKQGYSGWGKPLGVKEAERLVTKLEARLARLRDGKRDRLLTFEEMGVDDLTIDEAHEFKNLAYNSRLSGIAGMGNKAGSQKAMDLHMKLRSLHDRQGTSMAFLTGTPISNSVAEMYLILRNLVPNEMKEMGIDNFDAWRSMYVSYASAYEPTEAGGIKEVSRLGREWMNMKSLMDLYYSVSDAVTIDDIKKSYAEDNNGQKFPVPDVRSAVAGKGDREMVAVKPTPEQRQVLAEIVTGFNLLPSMDVKERNAERLRLMDRARKISLDPRAVDPKAVVKSDGGKIGAIVNNVARIWEKTADDRGTQLVFLDRSVPKSKGDEKIVVAYDKLRDDLQKAIDDGDEKRESAIVAELEKFDSNEIAELRSALAGGWNAYDEIKNQLVARGIPAEEIRFVQEANTDDQKQALFDQVKRGDVRVLIGSTPRMGAGTNVQDRLVALHHADVTWKPSDIEQREGRIVRQGNTLLKKYGPDFAVDVIAYATEMTVDAKMWALNATKLKAINGVRKYDGSFNMEFEDQESASMAEMAALATGNPLMVERVTLNGDINKLQMQERSFTRRRNAMRDRLAAARRSVASAPAKAAELREFAATLSSAAEGVATRSEARGLTVEGKSYTTPEDAQMAAEAKIAEVRGGDDKARFSIEVAGQKVTSMDAIDKAIRAAFGTPNFEATIGDKTIISLNEAANVIMTQAVGRGDTFTLDGITINGAPVEIDVAPFRLARSGEKEITYSALNAAGKQMAGYRTITPGLSIAGARAGLEKLVEHMDPSRFDQQARSVERDAAAAEKDIPGLEKEVEKPWPLADELAAKRARQLEVNEALKGASDSERLSIGDGKTGASVGEVKAALADGPDGATIQRLIGTGAVTLHETAGTLPGKGHPDNVAGMVGPDGKIHLVASAIAPAKARAVLLHEVFHSGGEALVGERVWRDTLDRVATAAARAAERGDGSPFWREALKRAAAAPEAHRAEEIAAYAVEAAESAPAGIAEMARRLIGAVQAWMLRRFHKQVGSVTPEQMRALAQAALRSYAGALPAKTVNGVRYSIASDATPPDGPKGGSRLFERAKQEASDFLTGVMVGTKGSSDSVGKYSGLAFIPTRPLFTELARGMKAASSYMATKQTMDSLRNHWHNETHKVLKPWYDFARKKENRDANKALMDIMHRSTLEEVDPSKPFEAFWTSDDQAALDRTKRGTDQWDALAARKAEDAERRKAWTAMQAEFKSLPAEAQRLYGEVRDAYKEMADAGEAQVVKNIQKALDHLVTKAEREHADEMQRIRDEGLTGDERDAAEKAADDKLAKVKARTVRNRAARLKNMRAEFESNRIKGPYFPLSRFGNYFVTVRDANGKVVSFSRFESARQQRRFATEQRAAGLAVEEGVASAKSALERNLDPKFVAEVESILEGADAPDSVRDAIWQKYLETLPDFSARKSRLHRKGRAGFATDAMRAFAHNMFHGSHQLARLTYGQDLQEHLEEARRQARDTEDPVRAGAVVNEMTLRHDFIMNPKSAPWAQWASSFAFIWTMGANVSSAIVNLDQAWTKGLPVLAYDAQTKAGPAKAAKETLRAARDFVDGRGGAEASARLTEDEKKAMQAGYESGLIDKTQAHDVAGVAESGVEYSDRRHRLMSFLSWPMHQTERFNREITFLAGYRIARAAGMDHHAAIAKATDLTWMIHFDNQSTSKPRFMQGDIGKVAFALKGFQANLLYRLFRDMHQSLQGATEDERRAALGRFAMTTALTSAAAGVKGTAFYSILMLLAGAFMGLSGSDDDPEEKLRSMVLGMTGESTIGRAVGGMMMDGIPGYVTGTSLSGRLGMADLWFRSNDRDMNADQTWQYWLEQMGGAPLSLGHQVWRGGSQIADGNIGKGIETMLPAGLKNPAKALRYAREGVKDKAGDEVVESVPAQDIIKQAIGFTPAEIADRYARNTFQSNLQNRIQKDRRAALQAAAKAERAGDDSSYDKAMEKVDEFNDRYPDREITPKNIRESMKGMERNTDGKEFGVKLHKGLEDYIKEKTAPSIYSRD